MMRVATLVGLIGAAAHAQVGPLFDSVPSLESLRVVGGSDAGLPALEIEFGRPQGAAPISISAVWLRVGTVSGSFTVDVHQDYGGLLASVQAAFVPNQWNRVALPNVAIASNGTHVVRLTPNAGADGEFLHVNRHVTPSQFGGNGFYSAYEILVRRLRSSLLDQLFWGGSMVFEIAGVADDREGLGCPATLPAVTGNPYLTAGAALIPAGTSRAQTIVLGSRSLTAATNGIEYLDLRLISDGGMEYALSSPAAETRSGPIPRTPGLQNIVVPAGFIPSFIGDAGTVQFTLTIRAGTADAWWPYVSTGANSMSACDPIARATFSGAPVGGIGAADEHADLQFGTERLMTHVAYRDRDLDYAGDPALPVKVTSYATGFVTTPDDCDDTDLNTRPGAPEMCDGKDNDCDGIAETLDSDLILAACDRIAGVCKTALHARNQCIEGAWKPCQATDYGATFEPVETLCDGLDNDCDGKTDIVAKAGLCGPQRGVCLGARATQCATQPTEACAPADYGPFYEQAERSCDGLDNDCDGATDRDDSDIRAPACPLQRGVCGAAMHPISHCSAAGWQPCDQRQYGDDYQVDETRCDGRDNDCDGAIDEGCDGPAAPSGCGCQTGGPGWALLLLVFLRKRLI